VLAALAGSARQQALEGRQAVGDVVEGLSPTVKIAICGMPKAAGSSSVPIFSTTNGRPGRRVMRCVPQSAQNSRVTARSRSLRVKVFASPLVQRKPSAGISINGLRGAARDVLAFAAAA
jgi:hypothetical protein